MSDKKAAQVANGDSSPLIPLQGGWHQLKVPLPFSLKWVNSYIIPDSNGYTVIDPGLHTGEALKAWEIAMAELRIGWSDISRIILTHQHPDHYGLAGYVQQQSGAVVNMTERSHRYALRLWNADSEYPAAINALFSRHGMPVELREAIGSNLEGFIAMVSPQPRVSYMKAGETLAMNGGSWKLLDAPGHAFGAVCLYEPRRRWMICGDQVLPRITPNISLVPGEEADPLKHFLGSLDRLAEFDVDYALPGHMNPFAGFKERIEELQSHHARRLEGIKSMLLEKEATAFEVCEGLFGIRLRDNPHNLRFAMGETLAHLVHLELRGDIASRQRMGVYYYKTVTSE
ncbi:hydrolase [Paenibacillus oryzae]|uniref:Hydrolase n=1 Tax=Paenibacillus oryzae TaxID=1844972 RepID=A0A1A5YSI6_9BACL|nr:MBL fold metallo-hydrolase [Paenibacillus oryzae]OBR68514.1 hydrolase [Paenibacillus oryzae]